MSDPLVSVVVPVYNTEKYLDRCVDSVVKQTYADLEIILVDDGSPDQCPQMCDAWAKKDSRIRVIHKKNAGLGMARNTGIEYATGEYICFLDSDDYISQEMIEVAYSTAKAESADVVVFGMRTVDSNGISLREYAPVSESKCYFGEAVQTVLLPDMIDSWHKEVTIQNLCLSACSCLISLDLIKKTGVRFVSERQNISEDSYFLIELYQYVNAVAIIPKEYYCYFENTNSLTRTYKEERYSRLKGFYQDAITLAKSIGYTREVLRSISGLFLSFSIAAMKQIMATKKTYWRKRALVNEILCDDSMKICLEDISCCTYGRAREILFWAMRHKLCDLCCLLIEGQNIMDRVHRIRKRTNAKRSEN